MDWILPYLNEIAKTSFSKWLESHQGTAALLTAVLALLIPIVGGLFLYIGREFPRYKNAEYNVGPTFLSFGRKFQISAVLKFFADESVTGLRQEQFGRPDQWTKIINIKTRLGFIHTIKPHNKHDIIVVMISRNGREPERMIKFNR